MKGVRLFHCDCMEILDKIKDESIDFCLTDIPYNAVNRSSNGLRNLDKGEADILTFDLELFCKELYRVIRNSLCIFCGKEQFSQIYQFFAQHNGTVRPIIWEKSNPSPMNGQYIYLSGIELAVWFKKRGGKCFNAHCKNTVFRYPNGSNKVHPTQKNEKLFTELILDNTNEHDIILDPCMGGGTTGIAAIKTHRRFVGVEIEEKYFKIAEERIEQATIRIKTTGLA